MENPVTLPQIIRWAVALPPNGVPPHAPKLVAAR
jgi:hypothetical protein